MAKYIDVEKYNNELNKIQEFICGDAVYGMAFAKAVLNNTPAADVFTIDQVLNVIDGMITNENTERNYIICEVYQQVAKLEDCGEVDFEGKCPLGHFDCICQPSYIKKNHPEWYKELGNPKECQDMELDQSGACLWYDDEDK